jgi:hypothetical protein
LLIGRFLWEVFEEGGVVFEEGYSRKDEGGGRKEGE